MAPFATLIRGRVNIEVSVTKCQGFFQPCSRLDAYHIETDHYIITATNDDMESTRDVQFTCDKMKCCNFQQLPIYDEMRFQDCTITAGVHGNQTLATSNFSVGLVMSRKNESLMMYSCERVDNLIKIAIGGRFQMCRGTTVYIKYSSSSLWCHGAFNFHVEPSECGYYRPDIHYSKELYAKCALAEFPTITNIYNVSFIDPKHEITKYYKFDFRYKHPGKCFYNPNCWADQIEIKQFPKYNNISIFSFWWSQMPKPPFQWRSWGQVDSMVETEGNNWRREIVIQRSINDNCLHGKLSDDCELELNFTVGELHHIINDKGKVKCATGYERIGTQCFKVMWPDKTAAPPTLPLDLSLNMTSYEAQEKCVKVSYYTPMMCS